MNGNIAGVKTEYSRDDVPLHESVVEILFAWSKHRRKKVGYLRAPTRTGHHPMDSRKRHIRPAGICLAARSSCGVGSGLWCPQDRPTLKGKRLLIHDVRKTNAGRFIPIRACAPKLAESPAEGHCAPEKWRCLDPNAERHCAESTNQLVSLSLDFYRERVRLN